MRSSSKDLTRIIPNDMLRRMVERKVVRYLDQCIERCLSADGIKQGDPRWYTAQDIGTAFREGVRAGQWEQA